MNGHYFNVDQLSVFPFQSVCFVSYIRILCLSIQVLIICSWLSSRSFTVSTLKFRYTKYLTLFLFVWSVSKSMCVHSAVSIADNPLKAACCFPLVALQLLFLFCCSCLFFYQEFCIVCLTFFVFCFVLLYFTFCVFIYLLESMACYFKSVLENLYQVLPQILLFFPFFSFSPSRIQVR